MECDVQVECDVRMLCKDDMKCTRSSTNVTEEGSCVIVDDKR